MHACFALPRRRDGFLVNVNYLELEQLIKKSLTYLSHLYLPKTQLSDKKNSLDRAPNSITSYMRCSIYNYNYNITE